ncbi:hypothetical protein V6N13_011975 [Hibiscus sabdariffa]
MEFLYGEDMVNNRALNPCERIGWADTSSLVAAPCASEYGVIQQGMLQEYAFTEMGHTAAVWPLARSLELVAC